MAIPSNLLPINNSVFQNVDEEISATTSGIIGVPNNLLRINVSDISDPIQSLTANILPINTPQYLILNTIIPDEMFTTGSISQVKTRTLDAVKTYVNRIPALPSIPSVPTFTIQIPRIPSYGDIKSFIKIKIDRIKVQRQKASVAALKEELKKREDPFKYRQTLKNQNKTNTVLGRYNNQ